MPDVVYEHAQHKIPNIWHFCSSSNAVVRGLDTLQTNLTFSPYQVKLNGDVSLSRLEICTDYHGHIDYMKDGTVVQTKGEGHLCFQGSNIRVLNILQPIRFCPSLLKLQFPKPDEVIDLTVEDVKMNVTGVSINGEPSDGDRLAVVSKEYGYPLGFAFARAVLNSNVPVRKIIQKPSSFLHCCPGWGANGILYCRIRSWNRRSHLSLHPFF